MPSEGARVFVSYARKNHNSQALIDHLRHVAEVALYQSGADQEQGYEPVEITYDELALDYGRSIEGFMQQVATSKHLILAISDEYLRSPYCMFECLCAYNEIRNRYHPAIIFVPGDHEPADAILTFDEEGLPQLDVARLKSYWETCPGDPKVDGLDRLWYRRYIRMASELTAWLTGRRLFRNNERYIPCYRPGTADAEVKDYIAYALDPPENRIQSPSGDILREKSISNISGFLKDEPELEKALNGGHVLGGGQYRREFVEDMLEEPASFVSAQLAPALESAAASLPGRHQLNALRKASDVVFGELVKYGARVETLHHQLQELNGNEKQAPIEVAGESVLPEMAAARLRERSGAFREVDDGEIYYVGRHEVVIKEDNILEAEEAGQDAMEQLNTNFLSRLGKLSYADEVGRRRRMLGPALLREKLREQLPLGEFLLKIEGLPPDEAQALMEKLQRNEVLRQVPVFVAADERGNVITTTYAWYDAIFDYYSVRDNLEV